MTTAKRPKAKVTWNLGWGNPAQRHWAAGRLRRPAPSPYRNDGPCGENGANQ
jgi:hypothetical protein